MVVGSDESYFARFEAVREAYFPSTGAWVGEYPFLDRRAMPSISVGVVCELITRSTHGLTGVWFQIVKGFKLKTVSNVPFKSNFFSSAYYVSGRIARDAQERDAWAARSNDNADGGSGGGGGLGGGGGGGMGGGSM